MKKRVYYSIVLLSAAALFSGCEPKEQSGNAAAAAQAPAPTVSTLTLAAEEVTLTRELPGRAVAYLSAEVRPQVSGIIEQRLFKEGAAVEAGAELYQLDDDTYQASVDMAKASLAAAEATLSIARIEGERSEALFQNKAISRQEYDNAQATLQQAEAQLAVAEASLTNAEVSLQRSRISAPIDGIIGRSSVTVGALVTANQSTPLATIQQLDPIYVDIAQSSSELLKLRRSLAEGSLKAATLPVTLLLEDGSEYPHQGELAFSEVNVNEATGAYTLRVVAPNPDGLLLPGMYLRGVIGEGIRENGILVPQSAISRSADGSASVMLVSDDNTVSARKVVTGRSVGNQWLIEDGLQPGDTIVVKGLQKVRPGAKIQRAATGNSQ